MEASNETQLIPERIHQQLFPKANEGGESVVQAENC